MLELPYKGGGFSMVLLAPCSPDGLPALEDRLESPRVEAWTSALQQRNVHVYLPKFKSETSYQLNETLMALGMKSAFTAPTEPDGADFSGMTTSRNPDESLSVGLVAQKAFIDVNETGSEASSESVFGGIIVTGFNSAPSPFVPTFLANRPFLYLIRDTKTGMILFLGRVVDPRG